MIPVNHFGMTIRNKDARSVNVTNLVHFVMTYSVITVVDAIVVRISRVRDVTHALKTVTTTLVAASNATTAITLFKQALIIYATTLKTYK